MSIADEKYVAFTTYKKSGDPVTLPVWITPLADGRVGFYTSSASWKAKRLRNNPSVTLQPCDMRGRLTPGSSPVAGTAVVFSEGTPEFTEVKSKIKQKYGWQAKVAPIAAKVGGFIKRKPFPYADIVIVISLA